MIAGCSSMQKVVSLNLRKGEKRNRVGRREIVEGQREGEILSHSK